MKISPEDTGTVAPILVFACGNPSRGDDVLGPAFLDAIRFSGGTVRDKKPELIEFLCDYQIQVEHTLDLLGRQQIVFVDAGVGSRAPFLWQDVKPERDASLTSHAVSPRALLQAFIDVFAVTPPPAKLLAIRGYAFELGDGLSSRAERNLLDAATFFSSWLEEFCSRKGV